MKGKNKLPKTNKKEKRFNSVQKKISNNKKNILKMPPIPPSKINDQIDFASNIYKLYGGMEQTKNDEAQIALKVQKDKISTKTNINKQNKQINNKKENNKNQKEKAYKDNKKNDNKNINENEKNNKTIKKNKKNINNENNKNEEKEDINELIEKYNEEVDSKLQKEQIINNMQGINQLNPEQFVQNENKKIENNIVILPQINSINSNLNQNNPIIIPNIIPNINQNINQNLNQNNNQNINQIINPNINQNNNQNINQIISPNINPIINQNIIPSNNQIINPIINPNLNPIIEQNINPNIIPNINQNLINSNINPNNIDNISNNNMINNQIISQLNYDLLPNNNILIPNQNIIPQNIQEIPNEIENINNINNFNINQNYNYPATNQLIDNIQFLNNNINIDPRNDNISNTPWAQLNLTYEEYEKKRIKEENRKKQEEFRKILDEQRVQKLNNKETNNIEDKTKKPNHLTDLPIIITNEKKIIDSLQTSLKKGDLNSDNQNLANLEPNNKEYKEYKEVIIYENQNEGNNQISEQHHEIIAKKYQDMLNNYIDEKTKDIEIQRNQVINDNNLIENFDKDIDNNTYNNIKIENELVEENINNIKKINNKAKLRIILNNNKNKNENKTEFNMFRKEYDKKNRTINSNNNVGDKKNITVNRINGKSSNMNKYYKIEGEQQKNNVFVKKFEEKKVQKRSRSLIPKVKSNAKSSEVKIKYAVKERKVNNNVKRQIKESDIGEDDPINKLQNIQKYIRGILDEYKEK